jgi:DNA-binding transcriptional regulator LsrR (DeoR family)
MQELSNSSIVWGEGYRRVDIQQKRVLVKAARLYYEQDLTQAEISVRLRLSRQKVQRLLRQAQEQGIVHVAIQPITGIFSELERELERRFYLSEAVIVETTNYHDQGNVAREVGAAAAEYLIRLLRPSDNVVISWGNSLLGMVNALNSLTPGPLPNVKLIQGLGGLGDPNNDIHATELVRRASRALGCQLALLPAPCVAATVAARDAFYGDNYVAQVLSLARSADLAFVGIGSSSAESIMVPEFWSVMTPGTLRDLMAHGAVGSINLRYFDSNGNQIPSELDKRLIGLTLAELKKIDRVVAVAGGGAKLRAIHAALRAKLINVLVTDQVTCQELLKLGGDPVWSGA